MSYELRYSPRAEQDLARVPLSLLDFVEEQLRQLAESPASLSRPSAFPYPSGFQLYQFHHPSLDGGTPRFTVLFRFGADESTLFVDSIGQYETAPPPDEDPAL